jgi:16S rRNA (cytosine967-C5)-methyltransferase
MADVGHKAAMAASPADSNEPKSAEPSLLAEQNALVMSARQVALDLLDSILRRRKPLDEALEIHPELPRLANRDRQFVRALVGCTLRHLGQIDHVLSQCLERPLPARAIAIRNILRLGAAQALFLRTPAHASVDTMVTLAARRGGEAGYKGLVNAVLRRITREADLFRQFAPGSGGFTGAISLPDWLWQSWTKAYGVGLATRIATAHLAEPPLDLTVKRDPDHWARILGANVLAGGTLRRPPHAPDHYRPSPRIEDLPGYAEGMWWVQDLGASLPVKILAGASGQLTGQRALDMCAAPGGKTLQLAMAGAKVTALDRSRPRMELLRKNLNRLNLTAKTEVADATIWNRAGDFDIVLLDAPCSATGTIRRHPDVAWLKDPRDIPKLAAQQDQLIDAALTLLRPGGVLLYCTCSLQPEEGLERVNRALSRHSGLGRDPIRKEQVFGMTELLTPEGDLRSLPCHLADLDGIDGFYAARLVKVV